MIRGNARRVYQPTEQPRQFAVSAMKGVDSTKAPTDITHATYMVNLVNNPDGSVSPRKPILEVSRADANYMARLHDFEYILVITPDKLSITKRGSEECLCKLKVTDTSGVTHTCDISGLNFKHVTYDPNTIQLTKLRTNSILSNISVNIPAFVSDHFGTTPVNVLDTGLYDDVEEVRPRYIRLVKSDTGGSDMWIAELYSPEVCEIFSGEGAGLAIDANLTLDNPYATRDRYRVTAPAVAAVVPYAKVTRSDGGWNVSNMFEEEYLEYREDRPENSVDRHNVSTGLYKKNSVETTATVKYTFEDVSVVIENSTMLEYDSPSVGNEFPDESELNGYRTVGDLRYCNGCSIGFKLTLRVTKALKSTVSVRLNLKCEAGLASAVAGKLYPIEDWHKKETIPVEIILNPSEDTYEKVFDGWDDVYGDEALPIRYKNYLDDVRFTWQACDLRTFVEASDVHISKTAEVCTLPSGIRVNDLTESVKNDRFRIVSYAPYRTPIRVYKAFCNFPSIGDTTNLYGEWSVSFDGINWTPVYLKNTQYRDVHVVDNGVRRTTRYYKVDVSDETDKVSDNGTHLRTDVCVLPNFSYFANPNPKVRFTLASLKAIDETHDYYDPSVLSTQYVPELTYGFKETQVPDALDVEVSDVDLGNASLGKKLMYKNALIAYGDTSFSNNVPVSEPGALIVPQSNTIDTVLSASGDVTKIAPWRDYLVVFTGNTTQLYSKVESGFVSKAVSTNIGIPMAFSESYAGTLNGFIFATEGKVYMAYPNMYSGTDDSVTLTDISQPVSDVLSEYNVADTKYSPFAFSTSSEYVLMLPRVSDTLCLRYEFTEKRWTVCVYPVLFVRCDTTFYEDIRLYAVEAAEDATTVSEFKFDADIPEAVPPKGYGDVFANGDVLPIHFEWDTGQKTDAMALTKQFVESKLVFTVEDEFEAFPMDLTVAVDGAPHVTHVDISTDAPFWKSSFRDKAVAGTGSILNAAGSAKGVIKQLTVRYSGKGRSVRHILSGDTLSPFRLYEAYIRYKPLNVKQ